MKQLLLICTILFTISIQQSFSQVVITTPNPNFTITVTPLRNNLYKFFLDLPDIHQVVSPRPPYYSYTMEYGDGVVVSGFFSDYSDTLSLFHYYPNGSPSDATCSMYNNYGNGTPPPPDTKIPQDNFGIATAAFEVRHNEMIGKKNENGVKIQPMFYPKNSGINGPFRIQPKDDITFILAYKNQLTDMASGQLIFLFNKEQFAKNEVKTYHSEKSLRPDIVKGLDKSVDLKRTGVLVWQINKIPRGKEQQIIIDLNVLPKRVAPSSTFELIFIPQDGSSKIAKIMNHEIEMSVVDERDPNKMSGNINKKLFKKEDYNYTIQFFNEGDGPVTDITLEIKEIKANWENDKFVITRMNIAGIEVEKDDLENKYELSFKKNIVIVKLKDVRLEGLNAEDLEKVEHAHASIDFEIEPKQDWKTTKAQTSIIFSDKDPVVTNTVNVFPQNRYFLGLEAGYAYDFIDTDPLARDEGIFFRGVTGWRFTDKTSLVAEFGLLPSNTETEGDNSTTKQSYFINPQVVFRLNTWWKASAGVSMLRQETSNYSNNVLITNPTDDSFRFLIDTHITPIQNRIFNVNIGARYYQPFDSNFDNSVHAYAALRINIFE